MTRLRVRMLTMIGTVAIAVALTACAGGNTVATPNAAPSTTTGEADSSAPATSSPPTEPSTDSAKPSESASPTESDAPYITRIDPRRSDDTCSLAKDIVEYVKQSNSMPVKQVKEELATTFRTQGEAYTKLSASLGKTDESAAWQALGQAGVKAADEWTKSGGDTFTSSAPLEALARYAQTYKEVVSRYGDAMKKRCDVTFTKPST